MGKSEVIVGGVTATGVAANLLVAGDGTVQIGGASFDTSTVYNGQTALVPQFCALTASASGATTLISLVAAKRIRILALSLVANGAVNVKFQSSASGDISGLYYCAINGGFVLPFNPVGWFQTALGEAFDVHLSGAVAVGGSITYVTV